MLKFFLMICLALQAYCSSIPLPAYPLAVKNPYLHVWLPGNQSSNAPTAQPQFWAGQNLTWKVLARVNGEAYVLFGEPGGVENATNAQQMSISFTSTHTTISLQAGCANFVLDFFSPVDPNDLVRQSLPYSYLSVSVKTSPAQIEVFSAIDDSWTAQQGNVQASFQDVQGTHIYTLNGKNSYNFSEKSDQATWGSVVLASGPSGNHDLISHHSGDSASVTAGFVANGSLDNISPSYTRGDLVALAHSLGPVDCEASVNFAIGLQQDYEINFLGEPQAGYYTSKVSTIASTVRYFLDDYPRAIVQSEQFDSKVLSIGQRIATNYTDLLEASVSLIFGSFQITIPASSSNTSQTKLFMKEISTDGNVQTTADLIPKALPGLYLLAPEFIRLALEPILEYSLQWPANYGVHDLGKHYPNATGETVAGEEFLVLDQTSVIIWMTYLYQKYSGNMSWAKPYIATLQKYTDYLVQNGLYPAPQQSSVDSIGATPNQTVLAIQSVIGINAFGAMTGQANYTAVAKSYASIVAKLGQDSNRTHFITHYGGSDSEFVLVYPFAFDQLLGLNTFNASLLQKQSNFYATKEQPFGIQFDSDITYTVLEWEMWAAATSSKDVRDYFINSVHEVWTSGINSFPAPTQWNVIGPNLGIGTIARAKPVVGSIFMVAALDSN